jgi:outer membrane protein assembly factor BamD
MKKAIVTLCIFSAFCSGTAHAFWIWTPKTGKWTNPKEVVKASPIEQLAAAKGLFDTGKTDEAKREFKKLLQSYPKAAEAAESQYYLGMIEEKQGNPWEAYKAYQLVVDKYPFSERIAEINNREFAIAEQFMSGQKRKTLGMPLPVENPAIEIFTKIVENAPFGPLAAKAQYKLGLVYKALSRFSEAEEAFNKVVSNYPESEWVEPAKFQLASTKASSSKNADYDQGATKDAKEQFEDFVKSNPDAALSKEAEKNIGKLKDKEAESDFNAARFYEKQKQFVSARLYYEGIITNAPDSIWAAKAVERLKILEGMKK